MHRSRKENSLVLLDITNAILLVADSLAGIVPAESLDEVTSTTRNLPWKLDHVDTL